MWSPRRFHPADQTAPGDLEGDRRLAGASAERKQIATTTGEDCLRGPIDSDFLVVMWSGFLGFGAAWREKLGGGRVAADNKPKALAGPEFGPWRKGFDRAFPTFQEVELNDLGAIGGASDTPPAATGGAERDSHRAPAGRRPRSLAGPTADNPDCRSPENDAYVRARPLEPRGPPVVILRCPRLKHERATKNAHH
jgi:hypothetical protein